MFFLLTLSKKQLHKVSLRKYKGTTNIVYGFFLRDCHSLKKQASQ